MNRKIYPLCNPVICCVYTKGMIKMNIPRNNINNVFLIMVCKELCKFLGISPFGFTKFFSGERMLYLRKYYDKCHRPSDHKG